MVSYIALTALSVFCILHSANCRISFIPPSVDRTCECGKLRDGVSNRIVGGIVTAPNIFPWVVAIFHKRSLHCGGALINDRYVLTAGHCVKWIDHNLLEIGLGMHDIKNPRMGYIVPISRVIIHKDFESDYLHDTNDIALIKLKYPVKFSDTVQPVCLPLKGSDYTNHKVQVTGWGRVTTEGAASRFLRRANLKIMPYTICRNTSFGEHLTESMLCAYADHTDACQGDSGGPLLTQRNDGRQETIGIVSWGIGCAQPNSPGIYVKNTDYLNWIKAHTSDAVYCMGSY